MAVAAESADVNVVVIVAPESVRAPSVRQIGVESVRHEWVTMFHAGDVRNDMVMETAARDEKHLVDISRVLETGRPVVEICDGECPVDMSLLPDVTLAAEFSRGDHLESHVVRVI
jgi:hypothetical protein